MYWENHEARTQVVDYYYILSWSNNLKLWQMRERERERERERGVRLVCEDKWIGGLSSQIPRTCPDISSMHQLLLICILLVKILSRGYYNFIFHRVFFLKKKLFFKKTFQSLLLCIASLRFVRFWLVFWDGRKQNSKIRKKIYFVILYVSRIHKFILYFCFFNHIYLCFYYLYLF